MLTEEHRHATCPLREQSNSWCWQKFHFFTLLHLRHILTQKQRAYFKLSNTRYFFLQKNPVQTSNEKAVIPMHCTHHILLSNAVTVTLCQKHIFTSPFPIPAHNITSQIVLNYYMRNVTSAVNTTTTIIIPILLDNLRHVSFIRGACSTHGKDNTGIKT